MIAGVQLPFNSISIRNWSLITRGGAAKQSGGGGGGGQGKFYPYEKGVEKVLAMLERGHKKCWGNFYAVA